MSWTVDASEPKPHVHPLRTPGGRLVTSADNPDHPWQRGLWFVVKYVDDGSGPVNFWEELTLEGERGWGRQRTAADGTIEWVGPDGDALVSEARTVVEVDGGDGALVLDWTSTLVAATDVTLDRTPYQGWGGYGGLALRGPADWTRTAITLPDREPLTEVIGDRAPWCDLSGPDGGVTILDHPDNPRHPTPWYGNVCNPLYGEDLWTNFLNAAFLFHEPMALPADTPRTFRYRVVVHDGPVDGDAWSKQYASGARAPLPPTTA